MTVDFAGGQGTAIGTTRDAFTARDRPLSMTGGERGTMARPTGYLSPGTLGRACPATGALSPRSTRWRPHIQSYDIRGLRMELGAARDRPRSPLDMQNRHTVAARTSMDQAGRRQLHPPCPGHHKAFDLSSFTNEGAPGTALN